MKNIKYSKNENGISIIITVIILNLILFGTLAISKIFTGEIQNSRALYNSAAAYYAAESGIEYSLKQIKDGAFIESSCPASLFTDSKLRCSIENIITKNNGTKTQTIKSTGYYKDKDGEAKRKIEINLTTTTTTTTTP
ncbi:hypothetical protein HY061_02220 [Candidatus Azambacteria bacterium]|nr:hypothetical protein [Candidatus Azambacteria bacterium]